MQVPECCLLQAARYLETGTEPIEQDKFNRIETSWRLAEDTREKLMTLLIDGKLQLRGVLFHCASVVQHLRDKIEYLPDELQAEAIEEAERTGCVSSERMRLTLDGESYTIPPKFIASSGFSRNLQRFKSVDRLTGHIWRSSGHDFVYETWYEVEDLRVDVTNLLLCQSAEVPNKAQSQSSKKHKRCAKKNDHLETAEPRTNPSSRRGGVRNAMPGNGSDEHMPSAGGETQPEMLSVARMCRLLGISKSTFYRQVASGAFPRPVRITRNRVGVHSDVFTDWILSQPVPQRQSRKRKIPEE